MSFERSVLLCAVVVLLSMGSACAVHSGHADVAHVVAFSEYSPVTAERLLDPEPENWLMYRRTYDSHGYSRDSPARC